MNTKQEYELMMRGTLSQIRELGSKLSDQVRYLSFYAERYSSGGNEVYEQQIKRFASFEFDRHGKGDVKQIELLDPKHLNKLLNHVKTIKELHEKLNELGSNYNRYYDSWRRAGD